CVREIGNCRNKISAYNRTRKADRHRQEPCPRRPVKSLTRIAMGGKFHLLTRGNPNHVADTRGGCNLSHCDELATQVAHVAKLINSELSLQPLGDRRVDVEVEHVIVPRPKAELAMECNADPAHLGAIAVAAIV